MSREASLETAVIATSGGQIGLCAHLLILNAGFALSKRKVPDKHFGRLPISIDGYWRQNLLNAILVAIEVCNEPGRAVIQWCSLGWNQRGSS
jgi:hypothetical protein